MALSFLLANVDFLSVYFDSDSFPEVSLSSSFVSSLSVSLSSYSAFLGVCLFGGCGSGTLNSDFGVVSGVFWFGVFCVDVSWIAIYSFLYLIYFGVETWFSFPWCIGYWPDLAFSDHFCCLG